MFGCLKQDRYDHLVSSIVKLCILPIKTHCLVQPGGRIVTLFLPQGSWPPRYCLCQGQFKKKKRKKSIALMELLHEMYILLLF